MRVDQRHHRNDKLTVEEQQVNANKPGNSAVSKAEYEENAKLFYEQYNAAQSLAAVETVYRKPKAFANLHEYDDDKSVDQVPTAIGFNSFDSADEVNEAKNKSRYDEYVSPRAMKKQQEMKKRQEMAQKKAEEEEIRDEVPSEEVVETESQKPEKPQEEQEAQKPSDRIVRTVSHDRSEEDQTMADEKAAEGEETIAVFDKYGLVSSVFSDDDSCPPIWKSFSEESVGEDKTEDKKLSKKAALKAAQRRREAALEEAKRRRALNSVEIPEEGKFNTDVMNVDPRVRRREVDSVSEMSGKKSLFPKKKKSSKKKKKFELGVKSKLKGAPIIEEDTTPEVFPKPSEIKKREEQVPSQPAILENKSEASSEPQIETRYSAESSNDSSQKTPKENQAQQQAPVEDSFAAYVYSGFTNLVNPSYWLGTDANQEDLVSRSREENDSRSYEVMSLALDEDKKKSKPATKSQVQTLQKVPASKNHGRKIPSPRKKPLTPSSPTGILSEISIPTPQLDDKKKKTREDEVSFLGLDKQNRIKNKDENTAPQQMKKKKMFGKILGRRTKASN